MGERLRQDKYAKFFRLHDKWLLIDPAIFQCRKEMTGREMWLLMSIMNNTATEMERLEFNYGLTKTILMRVQFATVRKRMLRELRELQGHNCVRCGSSERLEVDHIVPISMGGSNEIENLQILCHACNLAKGARVGA